MKRSLSFFIGLSLLVAGFVPYVQAAPLTLEGSGSNEYVSVTCSIAYDDDLANPVGLESTCEAGDVSMYDNLGATLSEDSGKLVGNLVPTTTYSSGGIDYENLLEFSDVTVDTVEGVSGTVTSDVFGDVVLSGDGFVAPPEFVTLRGWMFNNVFGFYSCAFVYDIHSGEVTSSEDSDSGCVSTVPLLEDVVFETGDVSIENGVVSGMGTSVLGKMSFDTAAMPVSVLSGNMMSGVAQDSFSGDFEFSEEYQKGNSDLNGVLDVVDLVAVGDIRSDDQATALELFRADMVGPKSTLSPTDYDGTYDVDIDGDDLEALGQHLLDAYYN